MIRRSILHLALGATALLAVGCADSGSDSSGFGEPGGSLPAMLDPLLELLNQSTEAPQAVRYSGVRRVESNTVVGGVPQQLAYRESVHSDGAGGFSIDPLNIEGFVPNAQQTMLQLKAREGFLFRYRDFQIRQFDWFLLNYSVQQLDDVTVADRLCTQVEIRSKMEGSPTYQVAVDQETALVLSFEERDPLGALVTKMDFETIDLVPDHTYVTWFAADNPETMLDIALPLTEQAGADVMEPTVYPEGFHLWKASTLTDPNGKVLVKQVLTDGVESLFLFHDLGTMKEAKVIDGNHIVDVVKPEEVWVYQIGAVNVVQGTLRDRSVIAMGKVEDGALLDLLESAID
ncbi:MAG: hypothetical protein AAF682_00970 [Planctomycetota bacterium]